MQAEWQTLVPVAGCLFLVASVSGYLVYNRRKNRKESLFGSTIKTLPPNPGKFADVPVQPDSARKDTLPELFSESPPEYQQESQQRRATSGLSSSHARWSSTDKNSEHSDEESSGGTVWRLSAKIQYEAETKTLHVTIFRAKCFPEKYSTGLKTAVHVSVYLLPEETVRQTHFYPNTGSPSFDETFSFQVSSSDLNTKSLRFSLYELDHSRTRICLGHTVAKLADFPVLEEGKPQYIDNDLEHLTAALQESTPEIHISLSYNVQTEKLKIQLFAARNLPDLSSKNQFVLATNVIIGTRTVKTKRTEACASLYGLFQCSYAFQIPSKHMDTCCLQFKVLEILQEVGTEKPYGQITIGPCMYAHGAGLEHWKQMLGNTKKTIEMWHKLVLM